MGDARWSPSDWKSYTDKTTSGRTRDKVFSRHEINPDFNPLNIETRESRDSVANPRSNAIIVGFDETGSMGKIPDSFVRKGLGTMVTEILKRAPVSDPHIMIMGLGDAWHDKAPLQVTQFEADIRIAEQFKGIYLESGGGGNKWESYNLAWYFAARKTSIDCFEKRKKKGYLFTVGDEMPPPTLNAKHVKTITGDIIERDLQSRDVLAMAARSYHVFHIVAEEGHHFQAYGEEVSEAWRDLLGQRVLMLSDYHKLAECVVSAIEINEGRDVNEVTESWSEETSLVIADAVNSLVPDAAGDAVVRF